MRWVSSVDDNFKFTFKLFKQITHIKDLDFDESILDQFIQAIQNTGAKKGCLLVQFPPGLSSGYIYQLETLLKHIKVFDPANSWRVVVEFRNKGWYNQNVYDLLDYYNATLVLHDIPASATPLTNFTSDVIYVRFHGPTGNYRGSYSDVFLSEYAEHVTQWIRDGKMVFVYFNNTAGRDAFGNLSLLNQFVSSGLSE
jgi:uncharacterized protein YecE (DUF72 family)